MCRFQSGGPSGAPVRAGPGTMASWRRLCYERVDNLPPGGGCAQHLLEMISHEEYKGSGRFLLETSSSPSFKALPIDVQNEIQALTRLLKQFGPHLGRPHVDTLKTRATRI